jgi:hypothetical protein
MYWTGADTSWSSAKDFCESRGAGLCYSSVLCSPERDPFGAYLHNIRRTPISDSYGKWLNIGVYHSKINLLAHSLQPPVDPIASNLKYKLD